MKAGSQKSNPVVNLQLRAANRRSIEQWVEYIQLLHYRTMDLTLDRISEVIFRITNNDIPFLVVSVAGTNGKGSVATMLESIFRQAGYATGLYTSPHLVDFNERFVVDGIKISDHELLQEFERVERKRGSVPLTFFEYGTAIAIDYFLRRSVDIAILEVGLGGRKDAVNVLNADLSCITSIGTDHERWLGNDREKIGYEKAGILRHGQLAVCTDRNLPDSIRSAAESLSLKLIVNGEDFETKYSQSDWNLRWRDQSNKSDLTSIPKPTIPGKCQRDNSAGAVALAILARKYLHISNEAIQVGIEKARLEGRLQMVQQNPQVLLDVAHNIESVKELAMYLEQNPVEGQNIAIMSALAEKPIEFMLDSIQYYIDKWHLCGIQDKRGITARNLFRRAQPVLNRSASIELHFDAARAFSTARMQANRSDRIVVFGSFLTVGEVLQQYRKLSI